MTSFDALDAVTWTSPPLLNVSLSKAALRQSFGAPSQTDLDSNGLGLFDAWLMRFGCGLEVAIWWFHDRGFEPVGETAPGVVEVHANQTERDHILYHLGWRDVRASLWEPDASTTARPAWRVMRLDDNGNEAEVTTAGSRCQADAIAAAFERKGHKQTYWVTRTD